MRRFLLPALLVAALGGTRAVAADPAPFDLQGPSLAVTITRGGVSLPIAEVPQLAAGDQIDVRADLPADQATHYVLVAAFLRGATNPPPNNWFFKAETWKKGQKGLSLTVPDNAEQVALFLAPETGGDFATLRNAVQGRPGAFVRAAQDLAQASLDHSRLETYLAAVRKAVPDDPDRLTRIVPLLGRSLQVKINPDCLTKLPSLQAACLLQNQESLVLEDGHSNAITDAVAGPGADLALQLSYTPQGGLGYFSPYIAAVRDIIGIFSSLHTAKYQYIPALAALDGDRMHLLLNEAPSFHNPKSVLVAALPIVAPTRIPPLQVPEPSPSLCAQGDQPLLPIVGAPLIYATRYAHDLSLRVALPDGRSLDLPATADVEKGGLVIAMRGALPADVKAPLDARVDGMWGFQPFNGPSVQIQVAQSGQWRLAPDAAPAPGASVTLTGGAASCVSFVTAQAGNMQPVPAAWRKSGSDAITITLPAGEVRNGTLSVQIHGPAGIDPDRLTLVAPRTPAHLAISLIARNVEQATPGSSIPFKLGSDAEVPSTAELTFSIQGDKASHFTGGETVEVIAEAGGETARLNATNGLTIVDNHVMIARMKPAASLGPSAFGPLRARIVRDGAVSDWLPIGTLVRLPEVRQLRCPAQPAADCTLVGDNLFLLDSVSSTSTFEHAIQVAPGYPSSTLQVPRPPDGGLYIRFHDAIDVTNRLSTDIR
jgi:hypothetical protein